MSCKKDEVERIESDLESGSQVALRHFTRTTYKEDGTMEWKLIARQSYTFAEEDRTIFYDMKFFQYEKGKVTSELTSDWGEINHTTRLLVLKGNIFLVTPDRKSLKANVLDYNLDTEELSSEGDVSIYTSGTSIQGKGLRAKRDLNQYTIIKPTAITHGGENPFKKD